MKAEIRMVRGLSFIGKSDSNHWLAMDAPPELRGAGAAPRPMELVLIGLAGCTGMDVVSILLKKRAPLEAFWLEAEVSRAEEHPKVFTSVNLTYHVKGEGIKAKDVEEAIRLSQEKYCPASAMISKSCEITYEYKIE
jgi:putative redox protein